MTARPSRYASFTVDYAIDQIDDADRLRDLVRQFRSAMVSQHEMTGHLLGEECEPCREAHAHWDPAYACDLYRRTQAEYEAALRVV